MSEIQPSGRGRRREVHTDDMQLSQKDDLVVSYDDPIERGEGIALAGEYDLIDKEYEAQLAFMEEPVVCQIEVQSRSDSPMTHVPVWVNGTAAEVRIDGKWIKAGYLPVGMELTLKRKYVEVLARAKPDEISTYHDDRPEPGVPVRIIRRTSSAYPLTIINDTAKGYEWLQRIKLQH
jgi:hypothetical protein